jgi:hypothetical protein
VRLKLRLVATGEGTTEDWIASKLSRDEHMESFAALEERSLVLPAMESAPSSFTAVPMARAKIQEGETNSTACVAASTKARTAHADAS